MTVFQQGHPPGGDKATGDGGALNPRHPSRDNSTRAHTSAKCVRSVQGAPLRLKPVQDRPSRVPPVHLMRPYLEIAECGLGRDGTGWLADVTCKRCLKVAHRRAEGLPDGWGALFGRRRTPRAA